MNTTTINREQWLTNSLPELKAWIKERTGLNVPNCRVSVGFSRSRKAIGCCFHPKNTTDHQSQVYISPILDKAVAVLETMAHELLHVAMPDEGHKKPFANAAIQCNLVGKPTATIAGAELRGYLNAMAKRLGDYPHAAIIGSPSKKKPQKIVQVLDPITGQSIISAPANKLHRLIEPKSNYSVWVETRMLANGFPTYNGEPMVIVKTMEDAQ